MFFFRRCFKWLASPYLSLGLLVSILAACVFGALLGSETFRKLVPGDGNQTVFTSGWFLVLILLLLINTLFCTLRQIRIAVSRYKRFSAMPIPPEQAASVIVKYGYHKAGYKYRFAVFSSPLFHIGLAIMLAGAFVDYFTGYTGLLAVRPGVVAEDKIENYSVLEEKPLLSKRHDEFSLLLTGVDFVYHPNKAVASGLISVMRDGREVVRQVIDDAHPILLGLTSIKQDRYGYYVNYYIRDKRGRDVDKRSLGLNTGFSGNNTIFSYEDLRPEGTTYRINMEFFPDVKKQDGQFSTASYQVINPAVFVSVYAKEKSVFAGLVKQGETAQFSDGNQFKFHSVTPYLYLMIQSVLGTYILVLGFFVFLAGLLVYYTIFPGIILVNQVDGQFRTKIIAWAGRQALNAEAEEIEAELNQVLKG